ncbi:RNA polymerase sigma factor [Niveispirillum sp.]|uniref:RNA polymerase sigma factor n=1 Tax=Niveispirillum sp. TaxID=1917217 RepID=UPI001B59EF45|nr:RNA polymerase sigma factor [Niveispirillum sp.]MBP7335931.1 RNA polymerase sigma factor [Niveispirillum sp.]
MMDDRESRERADWFARNVLPLEPRLRGWLVRAGWNQTEIEDLVQETYARLIGVAPTGIGHLSGLIFSILRNLTADQVRRRRVVPIHSVADISRLAGVDPALSADARISEREEEERLRHAIERLPTQCRQAFVLHKIEGLTLAQTAEQLHISRSTVEKHIARGMRLCADWLTAPDEGLLSQQGRGPRRAQEN